MSGTRNWICTMAGGCQYQGWCDVKRECYNVYQSRAIEQRAEMAREVPAARAINVPSDPIAGAVVEVAAGHMAHVYQPGIEATLLERGNRYGAWADNAAVSQSLKSWLKGHKKWHLLSGSHKEALEMIAQKIARILNGDANYKDNWHDISGYAKLGEDSCIESAIAKDTTAVSSTHTGVR